MLVKPSLMFLIILNLPMPDPSLCPHCHQSITSDDYFCPKCGHKLRTTPPSTSLTGFLVLFIKTLLLPPFGFYWGYRYLRQSDKKSHYIGIFVILLTAVETIYLIYSTIIIVETFNQQLLHQQELYGF